MISVFDRNWSAALWALLAAWLAYLEMRRRHDVEQLLDRKRRPARSRLRVPTFCSNCRKEVPKDCHGRVYRVSDWKRKVCRGSDGDSSSTVSSALCGGTGSWLVPLFKTSAG